MAYVAEVSDQSFQEEVLDSGVPVLVDFWAPWCGPCRAVAPVIEEVAKEYQDKKIKFCKINVEDNEVTAAKYSVRSIPALLLFKDGKVVGSNVGSILKNKLIDFLTQHEL